MDIPKSSLDPFGVIGIPHLNPVWAKVETIDTALHIMAGYNDNAHLSPRMMCILLRRTAVKAGAHITHGDFRVMHDAEVIFKVAFTLEPHGTEYYSFPSYYPQLSSARMNSHRKTTCGLL